jgi:hypothetical protein
VFIKGTLRGHVIAYSPPSVIEACCAHPSAPRPSFSPAPAGPSRPRAPAFQQAELAGLLARMGDGPSLHADGLPKLPATR